MNKLDKVSISANIVLYFLVDIMRTEHLITPYQTFIVLSFLLGFFVIYFACRFCYSYFTEKRILYRILCVVLIDIVILVLSFHRGIKDFMIQ